MKTRNYPILLRYYFIWNAKNNYGWF